MTRRHHQLILWLLIPALLFTGCHSTGSMSFDSLSSDSPGAKSSERVLEDSAYEGGVALDDGHLAPVKTGRSERRAARWIIFGTIVVFLVVADVFLLPAYHRRSNYFPCTRTVIIWVD